MSLYKPCQPNTKDKILQTVLAGRGGGGFDQDWEFQIKSWINPLLFHIRMIDVTKGLRGGGELGKMVSTLLLYIG